MSASPAVSTAFSCSLTENCWNYIYVKIFFDFCDDKKENITT